MKISKRFLLASLLVFLGTHARADQLPSSEFELRFRPLIGSQSSLSGPNCWNSALYSAGLVGGIRHSDNYEFSFWMSSPYCQEVSASEARIGDVVALRRTDSEGKLVPGPYGYEIHAYAIAGADLAFTKNGTGQSESYLLQDTSKVHRLYEPKNKMECRMFGIPVQSCQLRAFYFRCSKPADVTDSDLQDLFLRIQAFETDLHLMYRGRMDSAALEERKAEIRSRVDQLLQELSHLKSSRVNPSPMFLFETERMDHALHSFRVLMF